jgi:hypothetical protein
MSLDRTRVCRRMAFGGGERSFIMEWRYIIGIAVGGAIGFGVGYAGRSLKGG